MRPRCGNLRVILGGDRGRWGPRKSGRRWASGERRCRRAQPLVDLQSLALGLRPDSPGQTIAQQEIVKALEQALDARRQRIIESQSSVNGAKWGAGISLGILTLLAIAFVHSGNRRTAATAMALFSSAASVAIVMIAAQERPFAGHFAVTPTPLVQVEPTLQPQ